jgi:hypothetical protein
MANWKDYKKQGKKRAFDWNITESILENRHNNIGEILTAFGENCIDFILKPEDIDIAYSYIMDIFDFYHKEIKDKDRKEITTTTIFFLSCISDLILDNFFLLDVWGAVIYGLSEFKLFSFKDFDELKDLSNDQLKTAFEVVNKAIEYYPEEKRPAIAKGLLDIPIFKNNSSLLGSIINFDA